MEDLLEIFEAFANDLVNRFDALTHCMKSLQESVNVLAEQLAASDEEN